LANGQQVVGYRSLEGFIEAIVRDSDDKLVMHLKIPRIQALNHDIGTDFINEWNVTKTITRNGTNYEVLQYEVSKDVSYPSIYGGAIHYGIQHPAHKLVWKVYANYFQYLVQPGDSVSLVYTIFRPIS